MTVSVNPNQPPVPLRARPAPVETEVATQSAAVETTDRQVQEVERPSVSEVVQAAQDLSEYLSSAARSLQINVDGALESPIVTVLIPRPRKWCDRSPVKSWWPWQGSRPSRPPMPMWYRAC